LGALRLEQRQRADPLRRRVLEGQEVKGAPAEGPPPAGLELPGQEGNAGGGAGDQAIPGRLVQALRPPVREAVYPHRSTPRLPLPDVEMRKPLESMPLSSPSAASRRLVTRARAGLSEVARGLAGLRGGRIVPGLLPDGLLDHPVPVPGGLVAQLPPHLLHPPG